MDALFRLPNNDLSAALQKDKLFKEVEQQWNTVSSEEGNSRRKVDYEIYKSIVYKVSSINSIYPLVSDSRTL